jgi:hypothetical protein
VKKIISNTIVVMLITALGFTSLDSVISALGQTDNVSSGTGTNFADIIKQSNKTGNSTGNDMGPIGQAVEGLFGGDNANK